MKIDLMNIAGKKMLISVFFLYGFSSFAQNEYWSRHTIDASYSGADGVRLADINGDNLPDIATGWEEEGLTKVYFHPGFNQVKDPWPNVLVGITPAVEDAMFFDYNEDGQLDVISCSEGKNRKIYFNRAPSNPADYYDSTKWETSVLPASDNIMMWMYAIPADIDGKNGPDLIAGGKGDGAKIGWFESPKDPSNLKKWKWHPVSDATWVMSLFVRDMDDDGDLDIVISDRKPGPTNGIRWSENPGSYRKQTKAWENHIIGGQNLEVMFMDLADLDDDGLEDAITTEYTNQQIMFFKRLNKSGKQWISYEISISAHTGRSKSVRVGDINKDGKQDIVHSTETNDGEKSGIWWLEQTTSPTQSDWTWYNISGPDGIKYDRIELLDLDGDQDLDVLTCEENYGENSEGLGVIWYENPTN